MGGRPTPPGFDRNPTAWPRRILLLALAFAGLCVSVYLALFQIEVISSVWDPFFRSPEVLTFLGFPDASLGALAYATEVILLSIGGRERWRTMPWTVLALGVVIVSAAISLAIFGLGYDEPLAGLRFLGRVRGSGGSAWHALWGMDKAKEEKRHGA
jgi:hypothetical protein